MQGFIRLPHHFAFPVIPRSKSLSSCSLMEVRMPAVLSSHRHHRTPKLIKAGPALTNTRKNASWSETVDSAQAAAQTNKPNKENATIVFIAAAYLYSTKKWSFFSSSAVWVSRMSLSIASIEAVSLPPRDIRSRRSPAILTNRLMRCDKGLLANSAIDCSKAVPACKPTPSCKTLEKSLNFTTLPHRIRRAFPPQ